MSEEDDSEEQEELKRKKKRGDVGRLNKEIKLEEKKEKEWRKRRIETKIRSRRQGNGWREWREKSREEK